MGNQQASFSAEQIEQYQGKDILNILIFHDVQNIKIAHFLRKRKLLNCIKDFENSIQMPKVQKYYYLTNK